MNASSKIGIVSGVGPLAGSDVFAKVLRYVASTYGAVEDCEYPDIVLLNHGILGVNSSGTLSDRFEAEIVAMVQELERHGADIIGMACNTAHVYLPQIRVAEGVTLLNLIELVAIEASRIRQTYLLLTSYASKQQMLYHEYLGKYGVSFVETTNDQQRLLDEAIGLVMAHSLGQAGGLLQQLFDDAGHAGVDAVIAGCTELPIAIDNMPHPPKQLVVDSNDVLARGLVDAYFQPKP